ncbi:tripartite tricarboxylate transporter permease [Limnohabitans sp.]|jgi:TctA family transporter|uniref:tripartite tricarboxylate transporter permease n=1 Tax=Limnohabitans sp. TaxID=1907725 RepID=UPI0037BF1A95
MDLFSNLATGFGVALSLQNLAFALGGVFIGTLIGVLPGLGPVPAIAMLLPSIYTLDPTAALIMLAGVYYGAQYGGSTTAILINLPGESSSIVTAIDGYQMARKGRAGAALAAAGLGSFFAGCVGTLVLAAFAPALAGIAFAFGPAEYAALMLLGLIGAVVLASGSVSKAVGMVLLGLLLGQINTDPLSGVERFSFGIPELTDGLGFVAVAMGLFGFGEIIGNLNRPPESREVFTRDVKNLWPTGEDFRQAMPAVLRGTALGALLGVLPGGGAILASFVSYTLEKRVSKTPERFGHGAIEGVAGPESANNAAAQTSFIPMLTLGIPPNPVMALMIGAMVVMGITPGPKVMVENPDLFWGLIASMWIGNLMLIILNLPFIGIWVKLLTVPYRFLFPSIVCFCVIGLYTLSNNNFDIYLAGVFAIIGFAFIKLRCEAGPLLLGMVLGPMLEENLRRTLLVARGDWSVLLTRPISGTLIALSVVMLVAALLPAIRKRRDNAFRD